MNNRYKVKYIYNDLKTTYAYPDDIVVVNQNQVYNVTRGLDFVVDNPEVFKDTFLSVIEDSASTSKRYPSHMEAILSELLEIYKKKNNDYGNSFEQSLDEEGIAAARIRIGDKWNRFKQLSKGAEAQVKDESIKDTLMDMANYAIMTLMWLDK